MAEDDNAELFRLQDKVTLEVARRLSPRLDLAGVRARSRTTKSSAYDAYINGRYRLSLRTADDVRQAITSFERAVLDDPAFAAAYAGLADSYAVLGDFAAVSVSHEEILPLARAAARRAVELDDSLPEAHASLAWITLIFDWNWPAAEREFQRALQLNPRETLAAAWYAAGLASQRRFDEAIRLLRDASARDPFSRPLAVQLVRVLYLARRFGEAVRECERLIAADRTFRTSQCGLSRLELGDGDAAVDELARWSGRIRRAGAISGRSATSTVEPAGGPRRYACSSKCAAASIASPACITTPRKCTPGLAITIRRSNFSNRRATIAGRA